MRKLALTAVIGLALASPALAQDMDAKTALAEAKAQEKKLITLVDRVSKAFVAIGGGSGIIVSKDGEILTNHHVAGSRGIGQDWTVIRPGGVFAQAKMIASDPRGDISLLKMVNPGPYPFVPLGDSDALKLGQRVLALGNPFGFSKDGSPHVTVGLISALHRYQGGYSDAIQTDTAINPGNSGGPLITMSGQLIGINGRIAVRFGTRNNTGVGYAIPSNQIKSFMPVFRQGGLVSHGVIRGLTVAGTDKGGVGARVSSVRQSSIAFAAGLRRGDLIIEAGKRKVHNARRFHGIVGTYPAGAEVSFKIKRDGILQEVSLKLDARDTQYARRSKTTKAGGGGYLGVHLSSVEGGGVEVEVVVANSPAQTAGLQSGDVIKKINGVAVKDVSALVEQLGKYGPNQKVTLTIKRNGSEQQVDVTLSKRP